MPPNATPEEPKPPQWSAVRREDYRSPAYLVDTVELRVELGEEETRVFSRLAIRANPAAGEPGAPLLLDGQELVLKAISLDGVPLPPERYTIEPERLTIPQVPASFTLEIETAINPRENTSLEGLYTSGGIFCTQCEAEGFRRITFFPDRPDVMAVYTTTIVADRERCPVLLSNGNRLEAGELPGGCHFATWHDPFPKPCYLFALVAGELSRAEGRFTTRSGRQVALEVYVAKPHLPLAGHALRALAKAMRWDEEAFGREYDLDTYMIVAVDDFNAGAMENKGLNVFNSTYVLADRETATDEDFENVDRVIGHEYFHNWTGNRVTLRDWFQLSLKEGLTIFREQEFAADLHSRPVKRIADVRYLRTAQFPEDAGPLAHPVRPDSYIEISNFFTTTIYNKGAELHRMLRTLLGPERFRAGMDLYFARHDGQAVTVDAFVQAHADASGRDLSRFMRWFGQAGTPTLAVAGVFDPDAETYTLTVRQSCPPTPGQPVKEPFQIPLAVGLLDPDGRELPLRQEGDAGAAGTTRVLELCGEEECFRFAGLKVKPVPSLLRGFSAPVRVEYPYTDEELLLLMARDPDPFCRWEAGQNLGVRIILGLVGDLREGRELSLDPRFTEAFAASLTDPRAERAFLAEALTLPTESYLAEQMETVDVERIHHGREFVRRSLASSLEATLREVHEAHRPVLPYDPEDGLAGHRRLKDLCLAYLATLGTPEAISLCLRQYREADNMTDAMGALRPLASCDCPERPRLLAEFYGRWHENRQVVDKWFALQATSSLPGTLGEVVRLLDHPAFAITNPNRVRSLIGAFCQGNQVGFHAASGAGYRFLGDQVLRLNAINPQIAARMLNPLSRWRRFDAGRQELMKGELERILAAPGLSRDVFEVAGKSLGEKRL